MKRWNLALIGLIACGLAVVALAGDINTPSTAPGTNDFFTLNEIYDYLYNVDSAKLLSAGQVSATTSGTPANSTRTTKEIYGLLQRLPATGQTTSYASGDDGDTEYGATQRYIFYNALQTPIPTPVATPSVSYHNIVTDANTGLTWIRNHTLVNGGMTDLSGNVDISTGISSWSTAVQRCNDLEYAGYEDWRMPNLHELFLIHDMEQANPAINSVAFPGTLSARYWTSTVPAGGGSSRWTVDFLDGHSRANIPGSYYVRPVRGGRQE